MKTIINYKNSPAPNFDAVEDIREYFGDRYDTVSAEMRKIKDPDLFSSYCGFAGIEGFPVRAWYDHYHGGGAWEKAVSASKMPL